jgi:protein-tyrosine phosphatase
MEHSEKIKERSERAPEGSYIDSPAGVTYKRVGRRKPEQSELTAKGAAMFEILMVCTGNICRSPMAAGLLRHLMPPDLKGRISVSSAGTHALHGHQAEPLAVQAMARQGIDISRHRARMIDRTIVRRAGMILTMEHQHLAAVRRMLLWSKSHAKLLTDFGPLSEGTEIPDPYGGPLESYLLCQQMLRPCIEDLAEELETVFASIDQEK